MGDLDADGETIGSSAENPKSDNPKMDDANREENPIVLLEFIFRRYTICAETAAGRITLENCAERELPEQ